MAWGVVQDDHMLFPQGTVNLTNKPEFNNEKAQQGLKKRGNVVLQPQPSDSPDDPLNWSQSFKLTYMLVMTLLSGAANANLTILTPGIAAIAEQYNVSPGLVSSLAIGATAFWTSLASFFTVSGANIWGRRPFYIFALLILVVSNVVAFLYQTFPVLVAMRTIGALAQAPLLTHITFTISDMFFAHERGMFIAIWTLSIGTGSQLGPVIAGFVTEGLSVSANFGLAALVLAVLMVAAYFVIIETLYVRTPDQTGSSQEDPWDEEDLKASSTATPYRKKLALFPGRLSSRPFWKGVLRPLTLIIFPPVLYTTLLFSVFFTFLAAVPILTSFVFGSPPYNLSASQVGLTSLPLAVITILGGPFTGWLADVLAAFMARRNTQQPGVFEPEFRLVVLAISGPITIVGLIGLGVSLEKGLPLAWPLVWSTTLTLGGTWTFQTVLTYAVDCFPSQSSEVFATVNLVAAVVIFVFSGILIEWDLVAGHLEVFSMLAASGVVVVVMAIPLYIFGKRIRSAITRASWTAALIN